MNTRHCLSKRFLALLALFCMTVSCLLASDDIDKYAESRGLTVRQVSESVTEDATYYYYHSVNEGSLDGTTWYQAKWDEKELKATGFTEYTITFLGKTFKTTSEDEADKWLIARIDELLDEILASGAKENASPQSPQAQVADVVLSEVVLPMIRPRMAMQIRPGMKQDKKENDGPGPAPVSAVSTSWAVDADSSLRYERTWWKDEYYSNRYGGTVRACWNWGRFSLDAALPLDRVTYQEPLDTFDFTRIGLALTPRFNLISQDLGAPVDIDLGASVFYMYSLMDEDFGEDPQTAGGGPVVGVRKDFDTFSLAAGSMWMRGYDVNGNETGPGQKTYTDTMHTGLHVGVPVGDRWAFNARTIWNHIRRLGEADGDYYTVGAGCMYMLSDKWTIDLEARSNLGFDQADNISIHFGAAWNF